MSQTCVNHTKAKLPATPLSIAIRSPGSIERNSRRQDLPVVARPTSSSDVNRAVAPPTWARMLVLECECTMLGVECARKVGREIEFAGVLGAQCDPCRVGLLP